MAGLEVTEIYDIEPWAMSHLRPYGLVFCYLCSEDTDNQGTAGQISDDDAEDEDMQRVWFANQLSDDACASQAILNVLFNCHSVDLGDRLREFRDDTRNMSAVVGLSHSIIRSADCHAKCIK